MLSMKMLMFLISSVLLMFFCGVVGESACPSSGALDRDMGCEGEEELSLLQSRVSKRILSKSWCESPSSPTANQMDLFQQLLETAAAAMEANQGVGPAYTNLTLGPEGFMCAAVKAVYNAVYPPPAP